MEYVSKISVMAWIIGLSAITGHYYLNKTFRLIKSVEENYAVMVYNNSYMKHLCWKKDFLNLFTIVTLIVVMLGFENIYLTTFYCFLVIMIIWEARDHLAIIRKLR